MRRLGLAGVPMAGVVADPAVAAYLLLPGQPQYPLPELARRFLSVELAPAEAQPAADEGLVAAAAATRRLAAVLATEIDQRGGTDLMTEVEIPLIDVLVAMELAGIAVDDDQLDALETEFGHRGEDLSGVAAAQAGHPFNLGSPKQVQQVLFAERGLPRTKRTKTGYTTDAEALTDLYARTADPLLATILQWRDVARLRQTVAGLESLLDLRLPAADGLRLPAGLRQQLVDLERRLEDPERCELQLVQGSELAGDPVLDQRIAGFHLAGVQLSRLWLQGPPDPGLEAAWGERLAPGLVHVGGAQGLQDWLARPWSGEPMRLVHQDGEETVLALLLPGLRKERLQLRRIGRQLQLQVGGQRRLLALPAELQPLQPCGARVVARRLEVRFR